MMIPLISPGTQCARMLEAFAFAGPDGFTDEEAQAHASGVPMRSCWWKRASDLREWGYIEWIRNEDGFILSRVGSLGKDVGISRVTTVGYAMLAKL